MKFLSFLRLAGDRAGGGLCSAPCPPSPAFDRLLLLNLRGAEPPTGPIQCRRHRFSVAKQRRIPPGMAGIRFREVKGEGRAEPGPEDMDGIGYPSSPALARGRQSAHLGYRDQTD